MAEIDSLDIKIKASAKEAAKAIDKLCVKLGELDKKLGSIQNQDAFKKFADAAKVASASMNGIAKSAHNAQAKTAQAMEKAGKAVQNIQKPAEQAKKNISSIVEEMNKKFSALTPNVDFSKITAETNKYEKQLMNAQNQLQRIMATSSADKQVKSIERLVVKIKEAQNALDLIKKQKIQNATPLQSQEELLKLAQRAVMPKNTVDSSAYEKVRESMSNVADLSKEMADNTARWNAYLKDTTTEATTFSDVLKNVKPLEFSGNFYEMEKWVDELNKKLITLLNKQEKLSDLGANMNTQRMQSMTYEIEQLTKTLNVYEAKVEEARSKGQLDLKVPKLNEVTGQVTSLGEKLSNLKITVPTDNMEKLQKQIEKIKKQYSDMVDSINKKSQSMQFYGASLDFKKKQVELKALQSEYDKLIQKQKELSLSGGYKLNTKGFQESIGGMKKAVSSVHSSLNGLNKKLNNIAKRMLSVVAPTKKARAALKGFDVTNVGLAKSLLRTSKMLKLMIVRMALRGVIDGVKTGMQNLVQYSDEANASMSLLVNSLNQLKNSFAAAVSPVLNVFTPAINAIIQACISATNAINQLISALTGSGTWIKATVLTDNFAESLKKASKAAKTLAIDELNINSGDSGAGSVTNPKDMFDTEEVEQKYIDLADKIKSIFERLFEPLKQSWDTSGNYVFDSWKKALESIGELAKSVGRDFLEVWQQPETIEIFNNILHIIGDIGQSVSNIADNFRKAWEENNTGLHILENIRDIIGFIVSNIHDAAEATVTWSSKLDFSPLLGRIEEFTNSLIPVFDTLSGILTDFYTMVLLPLGKWTLEKGLPDLLQVFIEFNNKVDWDSLRNNLQEFWKHLEPFAETVGEGLVIFIRRISDALANFLNSETFENFLKSVENWMDKVTPEDVANGFEKIAKAIIVLKVALVALHGATAALVTLSSLANIMTLFKGKGIANGAAGLGLFSKIGEVFSLVQGGAGTLGESIAAVFGTAAAPIAALVAVITALGIGLKTAYENSESVREGFANAKESIQNGLQPTIELFANKILPDLNAGWEKLKEILKPLSDFISGVFVSIWNDMLNPALTFIGNNILPKLATVFSALWNNVLVPLGNFITSVLAPAFQVLSDILTILWKNVIVPLTQTIGEVLLTALDGLVKIFTVLFVSVTEKIQSVIEIFQLLWNDILVPIGSFLIDTFQPIFENVFTAFETIVGNLKTAFKGLITFLVGVFTGDWKKALNGLKDLFVGAFKAMANGAIGMLNGVISGIESLINHAIEALVKLASVVNKIPGVNIDFGSLSLKLPRIPTFQIGGFPEDGLFMANHNELVGQFSNGKTAVASNEMIVEGIEEAAYRGFSRAYEDNSREANLLSEILDAVREGKEISIDGRSLVSAVEERSNRNGFSFA
jgi:hypothetical protein